VKCVVVKKKQATEAAFGQGETPSQSGVDRKISAGEDVEFTGAAGDIPAGDGTGVRTEMNDATSSRSKTLILIHNED